jgi:hypothetical protein
VCVDIKGLPRNPRSRVVSAGTGEGLEDQEEFPPLVSKVVPVSEVPPVAATVPSPVNKGDSAEVGPAIQDLAATSTDKGTPVEGSLSGSIGAEFG